MKSSGGQPAVVPRFPAWESELNVFGATFDMPDEARLFLIAA
jgi:hypothetical protein